MEQGRGTGGGEGGHRSGSGERGRSRRGWTSKQRRVDKGAPLAVPVRHRCKRNNEAMQVTGGKGMAMTESSYSSCAASTDVGWYWW